MAIDQGIATDQTRRVEEVLFQKAFEDTVTVGLPLASKFYFITACETIDWHMSLKNVWTHELKIGLSKPPTNQGFAFCA